MTFLPTDKQPGLLASQGPGGGLMGLLANPLFQGGMGLLAASQDGRINPFQSAMQGFGNAVQMQTMFQAQKDAQEKKAREEAARQQLMAALNQGSQVAMGPPTPDGQMGMQNRPLSKEDQMIAALAQTDPGMALNAYFKQRQLEDQTQRPTTAMQNWQFAQTLPDDERALFLGGDRPSNQKEWEFYNSLSPEDQRRYLTMKRASQMVDLGGGGVGAYDPNSGSVDTVVSSEDATGREATLAGSKASAAAQGRAQGDARSRLGPYALEVEATLGFVDRLKQHPGRQGATGKSGWFNPLFPPGTDRRDFLTLLDTAKGKQFGIAYETLKGGGQITEIETEQATKALGNLSTAQSEEQFVQALDDFAAAVQRGYKKLEAQAGGAPSQFRPSGVTGQWEGGQGTLTSPSGVRYRIVE